MRMRKLAIGMIVMLTAVAVASADSTTWKGLSWTNSTPGNTTVTVQNDEMTIELVSDDTFASRWNDNWKVYASLPTYMVQDEGPWVSISFRDVTGGTQGGARAFLDTHDHGKETMIQSGIYPGFGDYVHNNSYWDSDSSTDGADWHFGPSREAGTVHTMKVGMDPDGRVDFWFDGQLLNQYEADPRFTHFDGIFLGVTTESADGSEGTGVYTDVQFGTGYSAVPEPLTMLAVGSAVAGLGGYIRRRRRA
jgi:hypothetical protein